MPLRTVAARVPLRTVPTGTARTRFVEAAHTVAGGTQTHADPRPRPRPRNARGNPNTPNPKLCALKGARFEASGCSSPCQRRRRVWWWRIWRRPCRTLTARRTRDPHPPPRDQSPHFGLGPPCGRDAELTQGEPCCSELCRLLAQAIRTFVGRNLEM